MEENTPVISEKQEYSCARCRRLKKKCTKESPACSLCSRLHVPCTYPGRAPRRTKKELEEAMRRGEYVPSRRRKKTSKENTPITIISPTQEVLSKIDPSSSQYNIPLMTKPNQTSIVNNNLVRENSNVSLPSVTALYNDAYSNIVKTLNHNNTNQTDNLPLSTTNTMGTTPPVTNQPTNDSSLYENVSTLISSLNSPVNTTTNNSTTALIAENMSVRAGANKNNSIIGDDNTIQRTLPVNSASAIDVSTMDKIDPARLLSATLLSQQPQNVLTTLNGRQTNMTNIQRVSSLPSMPIGPTISTLSSMNFGVNNNNNNHDHDHSNNNNNSNIDSINRYTSDPNFQQNKRTKYSLTSLESIRLSPITTVQPISNNNINNSHSTTPLSPSSVNNSNNDNSATNTGPTQISTTVTTPDTKYVNGNSYNHVNMNNSTKEGGEEVHEPMKNNTPYNIAKVESIPIDSASIETATLGTIFKGGRVGTWVNEDGSQRPIDRNLLDRSIAAYFRHNHRLYPMIDKASFLKQVSMIEEFDYDKLDKIHDSVFIFRLYMVMAIGCTTLRRAGMLLEDEEELSDHLAFLAMKKFCHVMSLQNIETVCCLLLLGIYSFFEPKGWSSWTISGIIMRLTIELGLNRDLVKEKMKHMTIFEVEARYRIFWSAYCFERLIATCLGRASAISDDDVTVPLPRSLNESEKEDIDITNTMIRLRRLAGRIYKEVHSTSVSKKKLTVEERIEIINGLRKELDTIFETEKLKMKKHNDKNMNKQITNTISFHSSDIWLAMRHSQLMILLYRPSSLIPKPPIESLSILGKYCLKAWKHTYTLYQKKLLPLNWITLFRTLTICNIILYCLCQWTIDLIESKIEIRQCAEILDHFGSKWIFAKKCAKVFTNISNTILEISLSDGKVPNMDKLTTEVFGANDAYHEILNENNVDVSWIDKLV